MWYMDISWRLIVMQEIRICFYFIYFVQFLPGIIFVGGTRAPFWLSWFILHRSPWQQRISQLMIFSTYGISQNALHNFLLQKNGSVQVLINASVPEIVKLVAGLHLT